MFDTQKFGRAIAAFRKEADMTQNEVADRLNLSRQAVSRYECGESFPDISILEPKGKYHGLYIEMKRKGNKATDNQISWITELRKRNYCAMVCYSADDAITLIQNYMSLRKE
jgi:transcriptional regulator with XRE-family HTH domain